VAIATLSSLNRNAVVSEGGRLHLAARFCGLALLAFLCAVPAPAQLKSESGRGPWDISVWTAGATGEENLNSFTQAQVWTGGVSIGRLITAGVGTGWRRFELEYAVNLVPLFTQWGAQTIRGGGFEPFVLRFSSTHELARAVPYLEFGGGALFTPVNIPPGRTSDFNFTARAGGGFYIGRAKQKSWDIGLRWYHFSNGDLGTYNPQFNSIQASIAYHWYR
jgi:Lipid A 3-O-deacylase (PagL)